MPEGALPPPDPPVEGSLTGGSWWGCVTEPVGLKSPVWAGVSPVELQPERGAVARERMTKSLVRSSIALTPSMEWYGCSGFAVSRAGGDYTTLTNGWPWPVRARSARECGEPGGPGL